MDDYDDVTSTKLYKNGIALQPVIADLIRNPEVGGRAHNKPTQPPIPPLP